MSEDREQDVSKADSEGLADLLGEGLAGGPAVPEIVVIRDGAEVTRRPLDMSPIHVGRHPGNELVLDDRLVSRRHAVITRELGQWWIRDAGSRHKLRIRDKQREAHAFKDGDRIGIGPFELVYQAAPATETVPDSAWSAEGPSGAEGHGWPMATLPVEIPGYRIEREIGRGGMGRVFEAVQLSTQRTVALKVMLEGPFSSEKTKRRFEREVHIVAGLRHPHIAQIYESGLHQGRYWFAMEFVEGEPLDSAADVAKLSVGQKLAVMAMVCEAVGYAHEHSVIHRDLKPTNILLSEDGQPHILDFGLAKIEDPERYHEITLSAPGELMGTPAYMSPEQTEREPGRVDARTDVYSLGVNLYKLLTRQFPYDVRGRLDEVIRQIATADPTPPSDILREVDDETEAITLKALAKNPDDRYASAAEMAEDLRRRIAGEPVEAKLTSRSYMLGKALARHRKLLATAGVLAVAVAGTAFVTHALLGPGDEPPPVVVAPESATSTGQQEQAAQTDELQADRASRLDAAGQAELEAREIAYRLEGAIESQDWRAALAYLETLRTSYGDTNLVRESHAQLTAWEGQIARGVKRSAVEDERRAHARLGELASLLDRDEYLRAHFALEDLQQDLSHTSAVADAAEHLEEFKELIRQAIGKRQLEYKNQYVLDPSPPSRRDANCTGP